MNDEFERIWWNSMVFLAVAGMAAGFCVGCGVGDPEEPDREIQVVDGIFSPVSELEFEVTEAAYEWTQATGKIILVQPGGVPVVFTPHVYRDDGVEACALTHSYYRPDTGVFRYTESIEISEQAAGEHCHGVLSTVLHEMGHSISQRNSKLPDHASSGLMQELAAEGGIDQAAIDFVCLESRCPTEHSL